MSIRTSVQIYKHILSLRRVLGLHPLKFGEIYNYLFKMAKEFHLSTTKVGTSRAFQRKVIKLLAHYTFRKHSFYRRTSRRNPISLETNMGECELNAEMFTLIRRISNYEECKIVLLF